MAHLTIAAEPIAVGEEDEGVLPADELATHLEHGSVGVNGALLVEHLDRDAGRMDDDERLAEDGDGTNIACGTTRVRICAVLSTVKGHTIFLTPTSESEPFLLRGHVEDIAEERKSLWTWRERSMLFREKKSAEKD